MDDYEMDSSDDELFFPNPPYFSAVDSLGPSIDLGRPSLRRNHRILLQTPDSGENSNDSIDGDLDDGAFHKGILQQPHRLLDLASKVVAKNCSCNVLEVQKPPLDEALLQKVAYWAFPQDLRRVRAYAYLTDRLVSWRRGNSLVKDEKIKEMSQVGFMATAYIAKHSTMADSRTNSEIRVSLMFEKQMVISSSCSECKNEVWCEHIIAAVVHRIKNPHLVRVHAPMTESLSNLDRTQLQKLLQYAVNEDPAGVLGKIFKHIDEIRNINSEKNIMQGAPDPTFGGLQIGDKSQWELSLELLDKRLIADLDSMARSVSYYNYSEGRSQEYYPDNYDIAMKMQSKFFTYITPILELARQEEYLAAAEVMKHVANTVIQKMLKTARVDCTSLSRLWHDLSHIYTLLLIRTEDLAARNLLLSAAHEINSVTGVREHLIEPSQWAELPPLTLLYSSEVDKVKANGTTLMEPLIAQFLSPNPVNLRLLLEGSDSFEKCLYDEDLVAMICRLEMIFYFERDKSCQKLVRLTFMVLHKLAILAQQDSVIGAALSLIPESCANMLLDSSRLSVLATRSSAAAPAASSPSSLLSQVIAPVTRSCGKGKSARSASKDKHPAKRFKSQYDHVTTANLSRGHVAHAMLYALKLLIGTQKVTNMELADRKLLTGFCLQALELSRHRTMMTADTITHLEHDWLLKLETCVCEYLQNTTVEASAAVIMYVDAISMHGTKFYNGAYPLVLLEMLCHLCTKNEDLKASKGRQLVQICSEILLNSTTCLEKVTLPKPRASDLFWEFVMEGMNISRNHRDFAIRKFHVITETFLSLVGTDTPQDVELLVQILQHFENIRTVPLLKMISKDLRIHVWRFKEEHRVIEAMLRFSIHAYRESQSPVNPNADSKRVESVDREFVFSLARKLGISSLRIFSETWQNIFSCKDLQELIIFLEPKDGENLNLPEVVTKVIMEFYEAKRFHEEDACLLLTRFFLPADPSYRLAVEKILENSDHYHACALFHLAQLQLQQKQRRRDVMDQEVFAIVIKAFERIVTITPKLLEYIDWVFTACTRNRSDPSRSPFYNKMIQCVCQYAKSHPEVILKVLQNMEQHQVLIRHSSAVDLGNSLIGAYKEHFLCRFRDCGHAAYMTVIGEMQRARLECKHYIKNGDIDFDSEVVEFIRRMHNTKKKLMKMLDQEFP